MTRFVCVHGHFYQPPRENPWTGEVDEEITARPYHDWNERITAECYAPNGAPQSIEREGSVIELPPNYSRMSFNFGPTLLAWLEASAPATYRSILAADRASRERFSGHGSAIAQAYNHPILPLANRRDKVTQVVWGIRDFEFRFGRPPEGMGLPETAVDDATLEVLAGAGIAFTILAPRQAARVQEPGSRWREVGGDGIDPREPYRVPLPSGRSISIFFYDGVLAHAIAFGDLARSGEGFARALLSRFGGGESPELVHVATDGETYGHHFHGGERALAEALEAIESSGHARLTNYGEYLERFPPRRKAQIVPRSSWSCVHGVGRWSDDCGCSAGAAGNHPWRRALREALDWLRDTLAPLYETAASAVFKDPWSARNESIGLVLDHSPEGIERFFERHAVGSISADEKATALGLLELQRNALLMYTSCGWFFDDPTGLETRQVLRYAARTVELAEEHLGGSLEPLFLRLLERVRSGSGDRRDASELYRTLRAPFVPTAAVLPS
jgi:alpha-amylase/alpha-mannosidase (GH57 family)